MKQEIPWNRFAVEAIVIVASILLAFLIEAWWSERNERESEIALLQSLYEDLLIKRDEVDFSQNFNESILESATALLRASQLETPTITAQEMNIHMFNLLWFNTESLWDSVPLNTLIAGGNASRITNQNLLQNLVSMQSAFSNIRIFANRDEDFRFDTLTPFLIENAHMLHMNVDGEHQPGDPSSLWNFPEIQVNERFDHRNLLSSREFQSLLSVKINRNLDVLTWGLAGLKEQTETLLTLLEQELN